MEVFYWGLALILILVLVWVFIWINTMANNTVLIPNFDEFTKMQNCQDVRIHMNTYDLLRDGEEADFLHGKLFSNQGQKVILFFHGSTGNISHRRYISDICQYAGLDLLLIDYRGYGRSTGKPSLDNVLRDGEVAYHYLRRKYEPSQIIIWGESLGGAVATAVAAKYPCDRVVLFSTFSSLSDVLHYSKNIRGWQKTVGWVCSYSINNLPTKKVLPKITAPILVVHSPTDDVVPYECCKELQKAVPSVQVVNISGQHATPQLSVDNFIQIMNFCHGEERMYGQTALKQHLATFHARVNRLKEVIGTPN